MEHLLDNMIWNAQTTGNSIISLVEDNTALYLEGIAPFAGLASNTSENLDALYKRLPANRSVAIAYPETISLNPDQWATTHHMDCCQMVCTQPPEHFITSVSYLVQPLTKIHVPQMLELTALTRPGPFFERTVEFGNYYGVIIEGRLAAMAGQRMNPVPYMEVSAVCTHPDFRGKGYAKAAMLKVMELIVQQSYTPFLHVLANNFNAIALYESIGFTIRRNLFIDIIKKQG
ncbi:MAG: GNAT family N-acetyltransferase [Bacteroidetes bacterium]|nr:GNAT family N-acetyltransferase [Bacteroidota bacterium]